MEQGFLATLIVLNQILNAGNAITAFSLLLYALTFNLREQVAKSFAQVLACVTIVYFGDVMASTTFNGQEMAFWLRLQWFGIAFLPAAYLHLSGALLASIGLQIKRRQRWLIIFTYIISAASLVAVGFSQLLAGDLQYSGNAAYLQPGPLFPFFTIYILGCLGIVGYNFYRAFQRCRTSTSKRRMRYLLAGSLGPLLGVFPFLMIGGAIAANHVLLFWGIVAFTSAIVAFLLILMAYSIAYYGISSPDRVVKARLANWILRGPFAALVVLAITVVVNRLSGLLKIGSARVVSFAMIASLLLMQFLITLVWPSLERWLFYGNESKDIERLKLLEERLLTSGDLRQYLESILDAACDMTGSSSGFIAVMGEKGLQLEVAVGDKIAARNGIDIPALLTVEDEQEIDQLGKVFTWNSCWVIPLRSPDNGNTIGLFGIEARGSSSDYGPEELMALRLSAERATIALTDRLLQREAFDAVDRLVPRVEEIQRMRAATSYGGFEALAKPIEGLSTEADLVNFVRDALTHYWGGPGLTNSPLMRLHIVKQAMEEHADNPINALRAILQSAIQRVRPEGKRRFTAEWVLYNILEMKFMEGRKVRDVALRLAMSEADLYRKQRVAINAVAQAIAEMEREATAIEESGARKETG